MAYFGNTPAERFSAVTKDSFDGDGSTTAFTLTNPGTTNGVEVFVENVQQEPTTAYSVSGTTLTFTAAPVSGTGNIYVVNRGTPVSTITHPAGTALQATTGTFSSDVSTEGDVKVTVSSGGIYTITGTDTATNRTLTLPDETGTVVTTGGTGTVSSSMLASDAAPAGTVYWNVRKTASQNNLTDNTNTRVVFEAVDEDSASNWDATENYYEIPTTGIYYTCANVAFASEGNAAADLQVVIERSTDSGTSWGYIAIDASDAAALQWNGMVLQPSVLKRFDAGDLLRVRARINTAGGAQWEINHNLNTAQWNTSVFADASVASQWHGYRIA